MIDKNLGGSKISTRIRGGKFNEENYLGDVLFQNKSVNQPFPEIQTFENIEDFKDLIKNMIGTTEDNDLNNALKIINTLISHEKKEVVASSLGNLYVLIQDRFIRELIINELNEMRYDEKYTVRESAEKSLDVITSELNNYEILDYSYDILNHIVTKLENYTNFKSYIPTKPHPLSKLNSKIKSKIINSRFTVSWDNMLYNLLKVMLVIDNDLDIFQMNKVEVDDYYENDLDKVFNIPYEELSEIETPKDTHLDRLATVFAITYRENGSITHLTGLLNDENDEIMHTAIEGLSHALNGLSNYQPKSPNENLINKIFTNINPIPYETGIKTGYASK